MKMKQAKIVRVLRADGGLIEGDMIGRERVCRHAGRCAIGALLIGAGVSSKALSNYQRKHTSNNVDGEILVRGHERIVAWKLLEREYGLTRDQSHRIMGFNDGCDMPTATAYSPDEDGTVYKITPKLRMEAVIAYIENGMNNAAVAVAERLIIAAQPVSA